MNRLAAHLLVLSTCVMAFSAYSQDADTEEAEGAENAEVTEVTEVTDDAEITQSAVEKVSVVVVVTGDLAEADEPVFVRRASVSIESGDYSEERSTKAGGRAAFKVPVGKANIVVTGQDTEEHWSTATCSFDVENDVVISFLLKLDKVVRECSVSSNRAGN